MPAVAMSGQRVALLVSALFCVLVAGVGAHGGNYERRYFRFTKPSWPYGDYRRRGVDGLERQSGNAGKQAAHFEVARQPSDLFFDIRSVTGGGDLGYNGGGGFPGDSNRGGGFPGDINRGGGFPRDSNRGGGFHGDSNRGGGFPGGINRGGGFPGDINRGGGFPGDSNRGGGFPGDTNRGGGFPGDYYGGGSFPAPSRGICPPARISCTVYRTRVEQCATDDDCGSRRKCCFDACVQSEVCKAPI
ncbi:uncharacterized protein [Panulirus ornatus]|uniref:uncharacterized protein n=1 Tax=Panulirus ornatus TaxID=150431 RepID=UPI003A8840D6